MLWRHLRHTFPHKNGPFPSCFSSEVLLTASNWKTKLHLLHKWKYHLLVVQLGGAVTLHNCNLIYYRRQGMQYCGGVICFLWLKTFTLQQVSTHSHETVVKDVHRCFTLRVSGCDMFFCSVALVSTN